MPSALSFKLDNNKLPTPGLMWPQRKAMTTKRLSIQVQVAPKQELTRFTAGAGREQARNLEKAVFNSARYFIHGFLRGRVEVCNYVCSSFLK